MLKLLPMDIEKAIAINVSGKLNKSDINEVIKAVEEKFLQSEQVSIYVEVDTFGGITLDALIADLKFALPNFKRFSKKAVITEKKWIERWIEIADPLFPSIQVRHFTHEQKAEAIAWLKT
ncbi:STAS/SEC14 domain-containing protein [Crocosphaera watsonii]|nr:STAS/SEC14 domain-containing protein [Crocosphaera watsonii]